MNTRTTRWLAVVAATVLALGLAACSDDDSGDDVSTEDSVVEEGGSASGTSSSSASGEEEAAPDITVSNTAIGTILADAEGRTLYVFTEDAEGVSNCSGACTDTWPPLIIEGGDITTTGDVDSSLVTTFDRGDGSQQAAIDGKPLYLFSGDSARGDTNGQNVGGTWFAVTPDGADVPEGGSTVDTDGGYDY